MVPRLAVCITWWDAGEFRDATSPHLPAGYQSSDYFAGRDPVLDAALAYEPPADIAHQVEDLLRRGQIQNAAIRYLRFHTDTAQYPHAALDSVLAAGHRLLDEGLTREGFYMMALAVGLHPASAAAHAGEGRAFELRGERDSAEERYRAALDLEPGNELAEAGLARLEKTMQRPLQDGQ